MQSEKTTRRSFLKTLAVTGVAVAAAPMILRGTASQAAGTGENVGAVSDFQTGVPKKVTLKTGHSVYVLKQTDGSFVALSSACTHRGCEILYVPSRNDYECPCHGGRFSVAGQVLGGPPPRPLPSYPVSVTGGAVFVG